MTDSPFGRQPKPVTITITGTDDRWDELQIRSAVHVELLVTLDGGPELELDLHRIFKPDRIRGEDDKMSRTLCVKGSGLPEVRNKPWALVLRSHDLSGTDYETIAYLDDETAREVIEAGRASWLYGTPDWDDRARRRALERARVMLEEWS